MGYLNLVGSFVYKEPLFRAKLQALADNDAQLKTDSWAVSTKLVFYQAAVPSGWTQDVSQNNKAMRVVGSTGGGVAGGGAQALSSTITLAHTHAISVDGGHTHAYADHTHQAGTDAACGLNSDIIIMDSGFLYRIKAWDANPPSSDNSIESILATPGALTLGTQPVHDHGGVTASSLTDFIFNYCDVIVGTKNAAGGAYVDLTTSWHTGDKIDFDPFDSFADNDAYNLGTLMPSGSIVLFGQDSAPDGWTKITSQNDRMLRVVSGTGGGVGGTQPISSGVTLTHSNLVTPVVDHTHTVPAHQHQFANNPGTQVHAIVPFLLDGPVVTEIYIQESVAGTHLAISTEHSAATATRTAYKSQTTNSGSGVTDPAGGHTHALVNSLIDFTLAYVDVIQCSKDSAGAPYSYTDYTAEFAWKKLVSYQRLNTLAKNDEYVRYHTTPSGSKAFFYMGSPPSGWVKITAQHDKALRIVSGGTGGSVGGGAHLVSDTILLAHTHTIPTQADHAHTLSHTHPIDSTTVAGMTPPTNNFVQTQRSFSSFGSLSESFNSAGGGGVATSIDKTTQPANEATALAGTNNHSGVTDSKLTDVSLAYADVIWCTKS
jgi:hypothetical protein